MKKSSILKYLSILKQLFDNKSKHMYAEFVIKPTLRGYLHQGMFFISMGACILMLTQGSSRTNFYAGLVYTLGVLSMFGVSALYHRVEWSMDKRKLMRKFDHSAIYLMIGGTFTPIALCCLPVASGRNLLALIWSVCAIGFFKSIFFTKLPKKLNAGLFVVAGLLAVPYLSKLSNTLTQTQLWLLISGGIVYIIGAATYAFKRPNPWPKTFGYHEVFHGLVSIAAILHFFIIYSVVVTK